MTKLYKPTTWTKLWYKMTHTVLDFGHTAHTDSTLAYKPVWLDITLSVGIWTLSTQKKSLVEMASKEMLCQNPCE